MAQKPPPRGYSPTWHLLLAPIALRRRLSRARRSGVLLVATLALAFVIAAHHAPMGDMHPMGHVVEMCLSLAAAGAALVVIAATAVALPRAPRLVGIPRPTTSTQRIRRAPSRAGPRYLHLLVVRR